MPTDGVEVGAHGRACACTDGLQFRMVDTFKLGINYKFGGRETVPLK